MRSVFAIAALAFAASATASDAVLRDVEQRLDLEGAEATNAYLRAHATTTMAAFNRQTAACDAKALKLALELRRRGHPEATRAHAEALRDAAALCPGRLLGAIPLNEVQLFCRSSEAWSPARMARELRRQIANIDADPPLRATRHGQACRAAYVYELEHTRVGLKRVEPAGGRPAR